MNGLNRVTLIGHLGADPELKMTPSGVAVMHLNLATNEVWKDKENALREKTEWHRVTVFGKRAEGLATFLKKGWKVFAEARLEHSSYDKDGQKHYRTDVVANNVIALGPPRSTEGDGVPFVPSRNATNGANGGPLRLPKQDEIPF